MDSLKQKIVTGLFWSYIDSFGIYFIKFGFTIAIARALSPSDYGLMGMIIIFVAIGEMLIESGFSMALIQKENADDVDFSTVFWFNILVAIIIYLILFFSADAIAAFFYKPILIKITKVAGLSIILNSLCIVHLTILSKEFNFKKQTFINFTSATISGTVGALLAYNDYGVWALVYMTLSGALIKTVGFWIFNKWRPQFIFSIKSFKSLFHYGSKILLQGAISIIFEKLYFPLIGKIFGASSLGFYTNANRFYTVFIRQTTIAYGRVTFPAFSAIQNQKERFNRAYHKTYCLLAFMMFPLSLFLIVSADPFVDFFLTEKWLPAVPLMQIFFMEGFFFSLLKLNQNTFNAIGRSDISLKIDLIQKVIMFISIFITFKFGVRAMIMGQVGSSFFAFVISSFIIKKTNEIDLFNLIKKILPIALITLILFVFNLFIIENIFNSSGYILIVKTVSLPLLFISLSIIFRLNTFFDLISLTENYIPIKLMRLINFKKF